MIARPSSVANLVWKELKQRIETGVYHPGSKLPPEGKLAEELGVGRSSVREALGLLEESGYIWRRHGVGSFVTWEPGKIVAGLERLESLTESIRRAGFEARDEVVGGGVEIADGWVRAELGLHGEARVQVVETVRYADGTPVIFCRDYLPEWVVKNNEVKCGRAAVESMLDFLLDCGITPKVMRASVVPAAARGVVKEYLRVPEGTLLLLLRGVIYDRQGRPVNCSLNYFRPDKYEFTLVRR